MSAYLLDTNAFSMALTGDPRLPAQALKRMQDATRLAVSAISFYEIGQKVRLGKWPEMASHIDSLEGRAREDGYDLLALTPATALRATRLDWDHRDPFDRMIAAIALAEDIPVISSDQAFDALDMTRHWAQ